MAGKNDFQIIISASDKATATIRKINESMSKMTRPFEDMRKSMNNVGKELGKNPAIKAFKSISSTAMTAAQSVARIAAPMAALTGVGSIAGVTMLATQWGRFGFELSNTSALLDVSTDNLQSLRGAAQLAGISAEQLTGGLESVRSTLHDARWGRNQDAVVLMNRLGMSFKYTKDGAVDAVEGLKDVADAIQKQKDIGAKHTIARAFGVESQMPMMLNGRKGIEEAQRKAAALGGFFGPNAVEQARQYGQRINELSLSFRGLRTTIGSSLLPVMGPLVTKLRELITQNREAIGEKIGEWAKKLGDWISGLTKEDWDSVVDNVKSVGRSIVAIADAINSATDAWDRWHNKDKDTPGVSKGGFFRFGKSADLDEDEIRNGRKPANGRMAGGAIVYPGAGNTDKAPLGLRNNNPGNLRSWAGMPTVNGFASFPDAGAGIKAMATQLRLYGGRGIDTVGGIISRWAPSADGNNTGAYINDVAKQTGFGANQHLNMNDSGVLTSLVRAIIGHENGRQPYSNDTINGAAQQALEITLHGLPQGTSATAKAKSGAVVPVRVSLSMPQTVSP